MAIEFKSYESKPITRQAFQIKSNMLIAYGEEGSFGMVNEVVGGRIQFPPVKFKAYLLPVHGDWVVRLTETDTYHCTDAVFRERNIVPE